MVLLFLTNHIIHSYSYDREKEIEYRLKYLSLMKEKDEVSKVIGNETAFIPDFRYVLFFSEKNLIFGYQFHLDRILRYCIVKDTNNKFLLDKKEQWINSTRPKMYFFSNDGYDHFFKDGRVKYIIAENSDPERKYLATLYPGYRKHMLLEYFAVYKYGE
jgi:YHS domain-containing protein